MKDISKVIKEFEKFRYKGYVRNSTTHELTDSYFYLSRQMTKCMMIYDALNSHVEPARTETNGTQQIMILHVCDFDESKSKDILADETYFKSVLRTRANQKALSSIKFLWRRANQTAFTK